MDEVRASRAKNLKNVQHFLDFGEKSMQNHDFSFFNKKNFHLIIQAASK